jgi:hypothetical protein
MNTRKSVFFCVHLWRYPEYVALSRKAYLVVLALTVALLAVGGLYLRQQAKAAEKAAAECDNPAPPPRPATPPPKLPDFQVEAACGPGETAKGVPEKKK